jgi:hypothetical protein
MMLQGMTPRVSAVHKCKIATIFEQLDEADASSLSDYLADSATWSSNALSNALRERGVFVSIHTVLKHRKGLCAC